MNLKSCVSPAAVCLCLFSFAMPSSALAADDITAAILDGKVFGDIRLRYETVEQKNALRDADGLTVRTRLGYKTGSYQGKSALVEVEDVRTVAGIDDYNNSFGKTAGFSVIADPEVTEIDQGFLQYKADGLTVKLGRQVIAFDNHRFVGHVGWRQDRQTFDAARLTYAAIEDVTLDYSYINQRNRIFAEGRDIESDDHLLNASWKTPFGKLTGYGYFLEIDNNTANGIDSLGVRFSGKRSFEDFDLLYTAEYADQDIETAGADRDTDYMFGEIGVIVSGVTGKVGYEVLGSDNNLAGFATPLATLHKFNGWADSFLATPAQGLKDLTVSLSAVVKGVKLLAAYHDYEADAETAAIDDFGKELNVQAVYKVSKHYAVGAKYADYEKGDPATAQVDTQKLWIWASASFK